MRPLTRPFRICTPLLSVAVALLVSACGGGSAPPAAPSSNAPPSSSGPINVKGTEKLGWDQVGDGSGQLPAYQYLGYVDNVPQVLADAACGIRWAQVAPKFKDFILPPIFTKRLCDVFDDELNRIAEEVGARKAFKLVEKDHKLVRFYLPLKSQNADEPVWSVTRKLTGKIGATMTTYLHDIARANPALETCWPSFRL